jgi:hypothetical protein
MNPSEQLFSLDSWRLDYSNGSGDSYSFEFKHGPLILVYNPVRPESSSSGLYSGGARFSGPCRAPQLQKLKDYFLGFESDLSQRCDKRMMGTGVFSMHSSDLNVEFIVKRHTKLGEFNAFLDSIRLGNS